MKPSERIKQRIENEEYEFGIPEEVQGVINEELFDILDEFDTRIKDLERKQGISNMGH
jgi:hypothetical protein